MIIHCSNTDKYSLDILQILCKYCLNFVKILCKYWFNIETWPYSIIHDHTWLIKMIQEQIELSLWYYVDLCLKFAFIELPTQLKRVWTTTPPPKLNLYRYCHSPNSTPTKPQLYLTQLSWGWHDYDFAPTNHHHQPPKLNFNQNQPQSNI